MSRGGGRSQVSRYTKGSSRNMAVSESASQG